MIIVYAYACGDILHAGHLKHLKDAKELGDILVVGVLTDAAVMEEKPCPTIPFSERLALISELRCVDLAIAQETYAPHENIKSIGANILAESTSHNDKLLTQGYSLMKSLGGGMVVLPYYPEQSSTKIKEKIRNGENG